MRAEDFLNGASSKAPMSAEDFLGPSEEQNATPKATDYLKGIASGVGGLASGVGYLAEAAGADKVGAAIRGVGDTTQQYWKDAMTPAGKRAAESQVFEDDPGSTLPKLGDRWGQALGMGVAQSAPSMLAAAIPGGIAAAGLRGIAGLAASRGIGGALAPLAAGTAAPIGGWGANLAGQVAARVPTALGFGAAEGATAGAMNAAQWKSDIEQRPEESLAALPGYASLAAQIGPEAARRQIAEQGAADIMRNTTLSTGAIGALTGGGALGSAFQRATTGAKGGLIGAIGRDAAKEAFQEAPQSAGERLIQNVATRDYFDPNQAISQGVLSDALSGAAIGGAMGGVTGGGSYAISGPLTKAVAAAPVTTVPPTAPGAGQQILPPNASTPAQETASNAGIASAAQFPQFTAPPQPVTGGAPLEQTPTDMSVPQAIQNAPAAPGSPSPVSAADPLLPAKQAEAAGAPIQPPQGPLPSANQTEVAIPPAQGPEAAALPVAAKPAKGIAAASIPSLYEILDYQSVGESGSVLHSLTSSDIGRRVARTVKAGDPNGDEKLTLLSIAEINRRLKIDSDVDHMRSDALAKTGWSAHRAMSGAELPNNSPGLQYPQQVTDGGGPLAQQAADMPLGRFGERPKTADISPDIPAKKAARVASSSGIAGALVTPQQPTFGGAPLEQTPTAMPIGEYGKRAAVSPSQTSAKPVAESLQNIAANADNKKLAEMAANKNPNIRAAASAEVVRREQSGGTVGDYYRALRESTPEQQDALRKALKLKPSANIVTIADRLDGLPASERKPIFDSVFRSTPVASLQTPPGAPQQPLSGAGERQPKRQQNKPAPRAQQSVITSIARRDDIIGDILRLTNGEGISSSIAGDVTGEKAGKNLPRLIGLFTDRGSIDLGYIAGLLNESGYNIKDDNELISLIRQTELGETQKSASSTERDLDAERDARHRDYIRQNAKKLKIKSVAVKFTDLEQRVIAALTRRHERAIELLDERAKKRFDAALEESYALLPEDVVDAVLVDVNGRGLKTLEFWRQATTTLRYMVADAKAQKEQEALNAIEGAEPDWLKDDDGRGNQPAGGRGEVDRVDEEDGGEAGFSLAAQTPEEIAAAEAAAKAAEAKADKEKKAAEDAQKKAELTAEVKKRSEAAADTFELGGNAMDNLTGQKDIFAAPASKISKKNDEKPKTINDADIAIANGKVTGEILGYMKDERDASRIDELRAKWRQSFAGNHAETIAAADITRSDYEKLGDLIDRGGITSARAAEMIDSAVETGILDAKVAEYMKKKAIPTKPAAKEAINDFGEKLEGARKDYASQMKDAMGVDVASEPLSKSWPEPDYQKLLDGGADPYMVAFVRAARDELPTKPQKSWKLAGWVKQAEMLRDMAQKLLSGNITVTRLKEILSESRFGLVRESVGSRAELYELVGHKMSLKGVSFAQHFYSLYKGQENVRKWVVEQKAKATVFSNWPRELAVGDTKEEVLAAFKDKIASLDLGAGAKRQPQFVIYRKRGEPGAWVGKKIGREYIDLHKAADVAEARKYMAESLPALEAKLAKYKETPLERKADNQPRVGDDHRNGAPVTPEVFADTFGFRGVQFGNYVEQNRRQSDLNEAFDGLMDLAAVLGIPPRALSLNGQLGLAFGARGRGGKNAPAAHFETGRVVINLTKGGGPGSLAHEWWHSLDNYFAKQANKNSTEFVTAGARTDGVREAMRVAFNAVNMATSTKAYQARSAELDKRRSKPYWNTSEERSARAFEGYVIAKLFDQGAANDYLANVVDNEVWDITEDARAELFGEGKTPKTYPYPTVDEMPAVRAAFDEFFKTVETKESEDGNVALFSFAGQQSATADQFQLDRAKQLLSDGANANAVRQQTGWFKNPSDGKWRYEIDDSGASLQNMRMEDGLGMRATSLETILDHPALFAAYPALRDMDVQITIDPDGKEGGSFERGSAGDSKTFGRQPEIKVNARTEEKALSTLLHEIQHGIQNVEGFASGGSPRTISAEMTGRSDDLAKAGSALNSAITAVRSANGNQAYRDILAAVRADGYRYSHIAFQLGTIDDDLSDVAMLVSEIAKKKGYKELFDAAEAYSVIADNLIKPGQGIDRDKAAYEKYRKLAGEVESRNVQQRQNFPADKRKYSDPLGTQDVAPEDVIVMFNGKAAKDAPAPANTTRASAMAAVGASPADAAVFDMASEGKSAQEILAFLSKASRRPFNRVLAAALSRIGVASTVSIDPAAGWRNNQGRNGAKFAASYSPKTDTVSLYTPREAERHILHELVHSASLKAIARGGPAARQMQAIFDYVQRTGTMSDQYGMGNFSRFPNETDAQFKKRALDEFTAELFTNPQFQVRLKQLPAPSGSKLKSAWDWIVRVIANLLGLKTRAQETALDRALSVGAALLQENAELTMPPVAGTRYHTTWHGSPHKFYTFDLSKIGTGEGAQAYGHGLYVAEEQAVADGYSGVGKALHNIGFSTFDGIPVHKLKWLKDNSPEEFVFRVIEDSKNIDKAERVINRLANADKETALSKKFFDANKGRLGWESMRPDLSDATPNLYKVDLPAEAVARMLDWDKPLSEQAPDVQKAFDGAEIRNRSGQNMLSMDPTGAEIVSALGKEEGASEYLSSIGIPGIRYLDEKSRAAGKGTSNFVLFDDKLARIIEVNGVETGVQPWKPGEWEAAQNGERFSQEQPFSGLEVAATPLKPGTKTLMVDGVERPELNSNGKPIHPTLDGVRNFWKWFGGSRVTDSEGRPLVVYHGTDADFTIFDAQFGDPTIRRTGFDFTADPRRASSFAMPSGQVMPTYLRASKPYRVENTKEFNAWKSKEFGRYGSDKLIEWMKSRGFDSIQMASDHFSVFDPAQAKSATGNTGAFSPEDPDIRYSLATNWQQSPVAPGNLYQAAKKKAASLLTPERLDKVIYETQDKFIDLRRIRDHIKEIGGTITDLNDAYLGEELYHKRLAYRTEQFLKEELQPFFADMKARGVEMPEFEKFLHSRHAPEANAEMARRNPNQKQIDAGRQKSAATVRGLELNLQTAKARGLATVAIEKALNDARAELVRWNGAQAFKGTEAERLSLSGMSNAAAGALMAGLTPAQRADMNALAAKVDAINEGTLQTLERYGLMDKASMNTWRNTYKHYVPLHRDEAHPDSASHPIGQGFNVRGDASKRRTGSNQEVTNIFGHIAMQREAALTRGEKNRVMQKLYLMARQNPIADIWSVGKVPMIDTIDKATGFVRSVPDPQYKDKPNVITLRIAGKDVAIVMNEYNPQALRLAQSIKNLDVDDLHYLIPVVGKATRWFASINTQYNPIFGLINFARDVQTAALNLSTTAIAGKQKEVFKDTMSILGDIIKNKGRMPTAGKWAPIYKEFNEVGGTTGYRDLFLTAEDRSKAVTDEIEALDRGKVSQVAHAVAGWLSDYNEAMENATRLAAYKAAIDNGMSKERAASLAKNLTVNFNRKGRQTRELGALYAFFNAAVQGTARMAQTLSGPAGKKIMLGGVLAGASSAMAGIAAMGGGDGEDDEWSKIPEFVKERSLIIPSPFSKEGHFAIPMPLGFHFLPNIGRLMVEMAVYKDKTLGKQMASLFTVLADAFNPLGGSAPPMQIIAPTVMDPFIALAQNKDWTGKPIYVENFNSLNPQPGAARAKDSATPIAKGLADAINAVTGGTKYVPGGFSPTPDQIDYVIGQLTGGVGREIGKLSSTIAAPFTGDELPAHKIPLLGRLYGSTAGATGQAGKFYENIKRANEVENELKGRRKDGISVDDYLQDNPKAVELAARGNAAERQIRALRQMRRKIVEAGGDDAASEARQINERMATVMRGFNMQVERMQ